MIEPPTDAIAEAEQSLSSVFLGMRLYHLLSAAVSVSIDRRRYRRVPIAVGALAVVSAESAWLAWRHRVRGAPLDRTAMICDVAAGAGAFALCSLAVLPDEQFTAVNWAFPMNLWTAVALSSGFSRGEAGVATAALMGTYAGATAVQVSEFRPEVVSGLLQYAAGWLIGDVVIRRLRRTAHELTVEYGRAVERSAQLAEAAIRAGLQRDLHATAVATLRSVRRTFRSDQQSARAMAHGEAVRLRRALRGESAIGLLAIVDELCAKAAARGVRTEVVAAGVGAPDDIVPDAQTLIATAIGEILDGCRPDEDERALVRLATDPEGRLEVTVRYRGRYEGPDNPAGAGAVEQAGGRVALTRPPAGGVRFTLAVDPK